MIRGGRLQFKAERGVESEVVVELTIGLFSISDTSLEMPPRRD